MAKSRNSPEDRQRKVDEALTKQIRDKLDKAQRNSGNK